MKKQSRMFVLMLCLTLVCTGCVVGPEYVPPSPVVPAQWQNLAVTAHFDDQSLNHQSAGIVAPNNIVHRPAYTLSSEQCPWWPEFLDEEMIQMIELQRRQSPTLHEFRAAVDQAWHQRWVLKRGLYPHIETLLKHNQSPTSGDGRSHDNIFRSDIGWEIDVFGGVQRSVEAADRNMESQIENWRNAVLFFSAEIGLYYTDFRVAQKRIDLQKQNIEFYEGIVELVAEKLALGGVAAIDLEEAKARLNGIKSLLPQFERARDNARVELARVVGVYSHELDQILVNDQPIPMPGGRLTIPSPSVVLPLRPDVRRLERKMAAQTALVSHEYKNLYPKVTVPQVVDFSDTTIPVLAHYGIGVTSTLFKRIIHPERERANIREQEAILQREIRNYERRLVEAASEVENAIVDAQSGYDQIRVLSQAVVSNQKAFDAVYSAYRNGLVDVRDVIRIRTALIDRQTELIFAKNLLSKSTIRLYKSIGGVDVPPIPAYMVQSKYQVADSSGGNERLSQWFSLFRDDKNTLKTNRAEIRHRNKGLYDISHGGRLSRTPACETDRQLRYRDQ